MSVFNLLLSCKGLILKLHTTMQILSYGDLSILSGQFNGAMMAGRRRKCDDCDYEDDEPCNNDYDCQFDLCDSDISEDECYNHCKWDLCDCYCESDSCDTDTCEDECYNHCKFDLCDSDTCDDECDGHCEWD